jgi:hypothetical protein
MRRMSAFTAFTVSSGACLPSAIASTIRGERKPSGIHAAAIYEASFRASGVFVAVDILKREDRGYRLIEVKSSTSVKEHHIADVAVQAHVLRQNGLEVSGIEVMHLNRACTYPDLSNLFLRTDVTEAARAVEQNVPKWIAEQLAMLQGSLPDVRIGPQCKAPYECPFIARCRSTLPHHHVSTLYRWTLELDEQGLQTIHDLPEDTPLGPIQDRQRRAVQEGRMIVEPTLRKALELFISPLAFLDFETVSLAVPVWQGCHPYDQVPVQFSCHVRDVDDGIMHHEWLANGPQDPRPILAERLVAPAREREPSLPSTPASSVAASSSWPRWCQRLRRHSTR